MKRITDAVLFSVAAVLCLGLAVLLVPLALLNRGIMRALVGRSP